MNEDSSVKGPATEKYDQTTAIGILVNAVHVAQSRGAWKLDEAEVLMKAVRAFLKPANE